MGNCLGLCELIETPNRLKGLRRIRTFVESEKTGKTSTRHSNPKQIADRSTDKIARIYVLDEPTDDVKSDFDLGEELGRGQFGVIRLCKSKLTGEKFACKSIAKGRLCNQKDLDAVRREIRIMKQLNGHPRIVELKAVYEDYTWVHLVLELCKGGELFDNIVKEKVYSEKDAAETCKNLMEAVQYCHSHGIIHRDLKPENILLISKTCPSQIKLADFGLAVNFEPGEKLSGTAGSAYYIAPEVLKGEYDEQIDVWSSGVILYILLCGVPPFWDSTEEGILEAIKSGHLDLVSDPWPTISRAAKHLIRGMLCPSLRKRLSPEEVLNHEWIIEHTQASKSEGFLNLQQDSEQSWKTNTASLVSNSAVSDDSYSYTSMSSHDYTSVASSVHDFPFQNSEAAKLQSADTASETRSTTENVEHDPPRYEHSGLSLSETDKFIPTAISIQTTNNHQCTVPTIPAAKATQIAHLNDEKTVDRYDKEHKRISDKHVPEVDAILPLEINRLLWSPCSTAMTVQTQAQLIY